MKKSYTNYLRAKFQKALLCFGLTVALGSLDAQAQVSVAATGGTASGSYTTLNAAFTAINSGTHTGSIAISITANTTEPATPVSLLASGTGSSSYTKISIKPSGGNFVINSNASPSASRGIIELAGADNVTIDGDDPLTAGTQNLTIQSVTATTAGIACIRLSSNSTTGTDGANNDTIRNCIIIGARSTSTSTTTNYGIQFSNGTSTSSSSTGAYSSLNTAIINNNITRCYYGINAIGNSTTYPNTGTFISGNTIGSSTAANNVGIYGINLSYTSSGTTGNVIVNNNDIQGGEATSGFSASISGILLSSGNTGAIIRNNNIHNIANPSTSGYGAYGIGITSATTNNNINIYNNFIRDITTTGYTASFPTTYQNFGIYISSGVTGLLINHNTIYLNAANATTLTTANSVSACIEITSSSTAVAQLLNNILVNNQGTASTAAYCIITAGTGNISAATLNNNDYYVNGSGNIGYYNSVTYGTLASWKTATTKDAASINEPVPFTSATDLHIPAGASTYCESGGASGATTTINFDIDGQTRPGTSSYGYGTAPDIGADEFDGKAQFSCTTPAPGATIKTPATAICLGNSVTFSLTSATAGTGVTYQWQSSPDNIAAYTDITGAISSTYTTIPTAAIYYRCKVTCGLGPATTTSTPVQVQFSNNVLSATPGVRCGTGTVSLAATGSTGSTLYWYTAATGGAAALASGATFVTPGISTTTTYYVSAEVRSSGTATFGAGTITNGTTGYPTPFGNYYGSNHDQYLITAAELSAAGLIAGNLTSVAFNLATAYSYATLTNFQVMMANTSATALTTSLITTGFTTVVPSGSYTPPAATGYAAITFTTPFAWDGVSNVVVDVSSSNCSVCTGTSSCTTSYTNNGSVNQTATSYVSTLNFHADNNCTINSMSPSVSGTTYSQRPNMQFSGTLSCSGARTAVTATVNTPPTFTVAGTQTVCNNAVAAMNVTSTLSNFNTYVWTPSANLYTDAGCTVPYVSGASATTVYTKTATAGTITYTSTANNSTTLCASTGTAAVTNLPATLTAIATPAYICNSGTTTLSLSPAASTLGAAGLQWQTSADNSTFTDSTGATGATLTTNVLTNKRYYRVVLKNSSGSFCLNSVSDTGLVYNPAVTSVTGGSRCGTGVVLLSATGVDGTLNWYTDASSTASLGTGTSFTTPSIPSTTTYYVQTIATPDITGTIGTGTSLTSSSSYPTAFGNYWSQDWTQMVYTAAELSAAGLSAGYISSIGFNIAGLPSPGTTPDYAIRMASTSLSSLSAFTTTGLTSVYGPSNVTPVTGWNTLTLTTPFYWDGVSNILIDLRADGADASANATTYYTTTSANTVVYAYYTSSTYASTPYPAYYTSSPAPTATNTRFNIQFGQLGCKGSTRTPVVATVNTIPTVTATATPAIICAGYSTTLTGGGTPSTSTYTWSSGVTNGVSFVPTATTTYTVTGTNPVGGCQATANVTVTVNPVPTVKSGPIGTYPVCIDSGIMLRSTYTGTGLTFQWYNGTSPVTGATKDSLLAGGITGPGTYTLKVNLGSCSAQSNLGTNLIVNPLPTASFSNTDSVGAICLGGTLQLTANIIPATSSYQWYFNGYPIPGATSKIYNAATGGVYTVRVRDTNNCRRMSDTMTVINTPMHTPLVTPRDVNFCQGTTIILNSNAGPYAASYKWMRNGTYLPDTTISITTGLSGNYVVIAKDVFKCVATSGSAAVNVYEEVIKPVVTKIGMTLTTGNYATYQWYRNGVQIPHASSRTYTMSFDGRYHVKVGSVDGCSNVSDTINIVNLGIVNLSENNMDVNIYPNPSQSIVNIDAPIDVDVQIKDIQGREILELKNAKQIDMSAYADGMYIFIVTNKEGAIIKMDKVVKRTN